MSSERLREFFHWTIRRTFRDFGIQNNEVAYAEDLFQGGKGPL
jgi:hypothetical protein